MVVTGKKVERSEIGSRTRTMAGAGPTDLHYYAGPLYTTSAWRSGLYQS